MPKYKVQKKALKRELSKAKKDAQPKTQLKRPVGRPRKVAKRAYIKRTTSLLSRKKNTEDQTPITPRKRGRPPKYP